MKIKKNGKVIRLTESDLKRIVKKVVTEQTKPIGKALEGAAVKQALIKALEEFERGQTVEEQIESVEKAIVSLKSESLRLKMEWKRERNLKREKERFEDMDN